MKTKKGHNTEREYVLSTYRSDWGDCHVPEVRTPGEDVIARN